MIESGCRRRTCERSIKQNCLIPRKYCSILLAYLAKSALFFRHFKQACCPMFRVAVFVNHPKHFDKTESLQPSNPSGSGNENLRNWFESFFVRIDFSICFQTSQKMAAQRATQFQIFKRRISTVKTNQSGRKSASVSFQRHLLKMIVFGFAVGVFIKNSIITRNRPVAISPK